VHVRSWQAGYRGLLPDAYLAGLRWEDRASAYEFGSVRRDQPSTVVAVEQETILGFVTTSVRREDLATGAAGEVGALYVDPCRWGRGVGRLLLADARKRLLRDGCGEAVLWVLAGNEAAERFYRADGWAADGVRREDEVWGVTVNEIWYRRALA